MLWKQKHSLQKIKIGRQIEMIQTDKVTYKMAYTQVLEILKRLPKEEVAKIPTEEIEFLKENCDKTYKYILSPNARLEECQISRKAYAILVVYF